MQGAAGGKDPIIAEAENAFREFLKEGREQGNLRSDLSDEAIITYITFFQQGIAGNPEINERMKRDSKFAREMLSLFIYGISNKNQDTITKIQ